MKISEVNDKELTKVLVLIRMIRPDCQEWISSKIDNFFCKHVREDLSHYDFKEYVDYIEKKLAYEPGVINIGVIMTWGAEFKNAKNRTWTEEEKALRNNFYNNTAVDTTN